MPTYKLSYFPVRWLAEPARWIFAYAGQEYEDQRFTATEWKDIKPSEYGNDGDDDDDDDVNNNLK